ncbi:hypothetical protein BAE44_0021212 [Dichanthelium oligosanthes]|uniref:Uncharacterized protein n=1 Tax=Dichanthelium oligosanthes TaxID=888268 RepID=A0A1E5UY10_9POAL|nr:hypothetical protein BAE44_0021212 [Dichanthelium oligosanthes]
MDRGFREELKDLLLIMSSSSCSSSSSSIIPRLFVRGRHVGGAEEVLRLDELGLLAPLLEGLPRAPRGSAACCCDGCGGMRFLPCFDCSGSRKVAVPIPDPPPQQQQGGGACRRRTRGAMVAVVRCGECNENGLVLCPICS